MTYCFHHFEYTLSNTTYTENEAAETWKRQEEMAKMTSSSDTNPLWDTIAVSPSSPFLWRGKCMKSAHITCLFCDRFKKLKRINSIYNTLKLKSYLRGKLFVWNYHLQNLWLILKDKIFFIHRIYTELKTFCYFALFNDKCFENIGIPSPMKSRWWWASGK